MEALGYWLALTRTPGLGPRRAGDLVSRWGEPQRAYQSGAWAEDGARPDWTAVTEDLAWLERSGVHALTLADNHYPPLLRQLPDAPPVLFVRGEPATLHTPQLAVVGSRNPTPAAADTAQAFARHLAAAGLTVTSGLAIGIDRAAHQGALDAHGRTVAVMGCGLDRVYPAAHRELAHRIVDSGGVLASELPRGAPPSGHHFPRRNRIVSGLATGTLVVEAGVRSGALTTARHAADQGREVFAIPGSIHNPMARGCHRLIRDGAKLVETAADVLEELGQILGVTLDPPAADRAAECHDEPAAGLDETEQCLLEQLSDAPVGVDALVQRSGLTAEVVSSTLLALELRGLIASMPGGRYCRRGHRELR